MHKGTIALILMLFIFSTGQTQELSSKMDQLGAMDLLMKKPKIQTPIVAAPLEHTVDPDIYILGPGDVLKIVIGKQTDFTYQVTVSPEGSAYVPSVGNVDISSLSLTEAKQKMKEALRNKYVSKDINIFLVQLRSFRVTVSGAVYKPGLVTVSAMNRVSEAIELAGSFKKPIRVIKKTEQVNVTTPAREDVIVKTQDVNENAVLKNEAASKRNIIVKRRNGQTVKADIQKYELAGDLDANPYLQDGDVIFVPTEQIDVGRVAIYGAVKAPDDFEFVPGDRVKDLLAMGSGFTVDADSSQIELVRFNSDFHSVRRTILHLDPANPEKTMDILNTPLQPDDRLFIRAIPRYHNKIDVEISGEIKYPGYYALENKKKTLSTVIERAGGFTKDASLKNAFVVRRAREDVQDPEFERLKEMDVADMTEMEREYFKTKSRERVGGMGVNFVALFEKGDKSQDVILRDNDLIVIPAKEMTVKVSGQVINPGLFPFDANKPLRYYVDEAGGYNWNARKSKIRVIKAKTGEWVKAKDSTPIDIGDAIFIPEKPERDYWQLAKDLIAVTAQVATIYLVVERASGK
ncbi:MAG: hypothetical protein GWP06_08875 [Actinobacteria bacterium]|nr:hypothetical protein [Actinomycetota bacterium]